MPNRVQKRNNRRGKKNAAPSTPNTRSTAVVAPQNNLNTIKAEESTGAVTCEQCGLRLKQELPVFYRFIATPSAKGKGKLLFCGGCAQVHEAKKELNSKCANCK
jgi:hypothetical protein